MRIGFQREYSNYSVCEEILCYMESKFKRWDKTGREIYRDESFIPNSSWFSVQKFGFHFTAPENRSVVDQIAYFVALKTLMSVVCKAVLGDDRQD